MLPKNEPYNPFDWMIVEQSLEEELTLERSIREIEDCKDINTMSQLCTGMMRQQWQQNKLLHQAINHIAEMDALIAGGVQML